MEKLLQSCRDSFAAECIKAFAPFVKLTPAKNRAVSIAVISAPESLSQAAALGRLSRNQAVKTLANVMTGALERGGT